MANFFAFLIFVFPFPVVCVMCVYVCLRLGLSSGEVLPQRLKWENAPAPFNYRGIKSSVTVVVLDLKTHLAKNWTK